MAGSKIPEELLQDPTRIEVRKVTLGLIEQATGSGNARSVKPGQAKNYFEFCELVKETIDDYQRRTQVPGNRKVQLSWERPNNTAESELITICLKSRTPGVFDRGAPKEGSIKNWRPILREKVEDLENPGYLKAVFGKWFDNIIGFTVWAQTNKEAIERAFWFESLMEEYAWYFAASGVGRVLFMEQAEDEFVDNDGQKLYGRELRFFVRTEKITEMSEKTLENMYVNLFVGKTI